MTKATSNPFVMEDQSTTDSLREFAESTQPHQRLMYSKGLGVYGFFEVTKDDITKFCHAEIFSKVGKRTDLVCRFSQLRDINELDRDVRGFALKFYTEEGCWDIVGNNLPVSFLRNPQLFPEFIRLNNIVINGQQSDYDALWNFLALHPETLHYLTLFYGDRGMPNGFRHMNGYGINTFANINSESEKFFVRYHICTNQGIKVLTPDEAKSLSHQNPMYFSKDLLDAIQQNNFPSWTLCAQVMNIEQAVNLHFNPFDPTKVWPHGEFPLLEIGKITLNRLPKDFKQEIEKLSFSVTNLIPGIEPSLDPILAGRLYAYPIAQEKRGVATEEKHGNVVKDTAKRIGEKLEHALSKTVGRVKSLSKEEVTKQQEEQKILVEKWGDPNKLETEDEDNDYKQPRVFFEEVLSKQAQRRLCLYLAKDLCVVNHEIQTKFVKQLQQISQSYGDGVRDCMLSSDIKNVELEHREEAEMITEP